MNSRIRLQFYSLITFWVFLVSLAGPLAVFADDGVPPTESATATEEASDTLETGGSESPPEAATPEPNSTTEETAPVEIAPTKEAVVDNNTPTAEVSNEVNIVQPDPDSGEVITVAELLDAAPEGTEVIVLDEDGELLPLASEEAAQIVVAGDPMWCPDGVLPFGLGCTSTQTSLSDLYSLLSTDSVTYNGNGTIYIAADYDVATAGDGPFIVLDHLNTKLRNLVFQGGWDFTTNTVVGQTTINGASLEFWNWGFGPSADLTINDIYITAVTGNSPFNNNTVGDDSALVVNTYPLFPFVGDADVELNNVDVIGNTGGAHIHTRGSVTVGTTLQGYSEFNDNNGGSIWSAGLVVGSPNGPVYIDGPDVFNNEDDGIDIFTDGDVIISDGTWVIGNGYDGVSISGYSPPAFGNNSYANDVIIGDGRYEDNGDGTHTYEYGLWIFACSLSPDPIMSDFMPLNTSGDYMFVQDPICGGSGAPVSPPSFGLPGTGGEKYVVPPATEEGNGGEDGGDDAGNSSLPPSSILITGLSFKTIQAQHGESNILDCTQSGGTTLLLPNGSSLTFMCPTVGEASIAPLDHQDLPNDLPEDTEFVSGLEGSLDNGDTPPLPGPVVVSFAIPEGMDGEDFAIFFWNGSEWEELDGSVVELDAFQTITNQAGIFVLVVR